MPEVAKKRKFYAPKEGTRAVLAAIERAMQQPREITVGDRVRWNGYTGRVLAVQGDTAIVEEPNNLAFGRPVEWRLALASLTRVGHP